MTEQGSLFDDLPVYLGPVTKHPLYRVWCGIISRCHSPKCTGFVNYGGRGIFVCDEWRNHARAFIAWGISNGWQRGLQIDRIDNDGPYSPGNCRFVTRSQNQLNRRVTPRLTDGRPALAVARANGVCLDTFHSRRCLGWSLEDAALIPVGTTGVRLLLDGRPAALVAQENGVPAPMFYARRYRGWSLEDAASVPVGLFLKTGKAVCLSDGRPAWPVAKANGISGPIYRGRVRRGWSPDDAVSIPVGGKRPLPDGFQSVGDAAASVVAATVAKIAQGESEASALGDPAQRSAARRKPKAKRKGRAPAIPSGLVDLPSPDLPSPSYDPGYPSDWLAKGKGHA